MAIAYTDLLAAVIFHPGFQLFGINLFMVFMAFIAMPKSVKGRYPVIPSIEVNRNRKSINVIVSKF